MRSKLFCAALMCLMGISALATEIKPVTGTWLNLVWQDDRNNYMNLRGADNMNPAFWETKVGELHEMGVDYLVIMQLANEGKTFYPSAIMPAAYPEGQKSPLDAILEKASIWRASYSGIKVR